MRYIEPVIITKDNIKLVIEFKNDTATIQYYFENELVDSVILPRTNNIVNFIADKTELKENTIRRYIYKNKREKFIKDELITFQNDAMNVLDIERLIKTLRKR